MAVKLRAGHQHTAVCVGSLPCSSDEERATSGKHAARKEFIIVASYCEHEGADDGGGGGLAAGAQDGLRRVQGLLSFFEIRRDTAADASAAGCVCFHLLQPVTCVCNMQCVTLRSGRK